MTTTTQTRKYQVAATCGEGTETRLTRPLSLRDARANCSMRRREMYARGASRAAANRAFVVLPAR